MMSSTETAGYDDRASLGFNVMSMHPPEIQRARGKQTEEKETRELVFLKKYVSMKTCSVDRL